MSINLTKKIQEAFIRMCQNNDKRYKEIINNIINSQLSDEQITDLVDKEISNFKKAPHTLNLGFYITLDLGELFRIGVEENLWVLDKNNKAIDFSLSRNYIRQNHMDSIHAYELFEKFFKADENIINFRNRLMSLFPNSRISDGTCYWYEPSGNLELKFHISVNLNENKI